MKHYVVSCVVLAFILVQTGCRAEDTDAAKAVPAPAAPARIPAEWTRCAADADCLVEPFPCGGWAVLNKNSAENFIKKFGIPEAANCEGGAPMGPPPATRCVEHECLPTKEQRNASYFEWRKENPIGQTLP